MLARGHYELWERLGIFTESFHLHRSYELFQEYASNHLDTMSCDDLLLYCKVLQHCNDMKTASEVIQQILMNHDTHPDYANFLFYAGAIYKALHQHIKANNYFFDSVQIGPPKFFNKLEMMIIITRTIEEQNGEEESDDNAYRMVHNHMILEGNIPEDLEYDDWISDSTTWLNLGDKAAFHQQFSLASDFYGLGITRDPDAFKKPMLWFRFAKACLRCGRLSDAQLAIKVSNLMVLFIFIYFYYIYFLFYDSKH